MKHNLHVLKLFLITCAGIILSSCQKERCAEPAAAQGDYYPTRVGSQWIYETTLRSRWDTASYSQTIEALKDTLYEGKSYTYFALQLIRKEKGNYYRRTHIYGVGEEYLFLKDNVPAGSTWTHSSSEHHKAEFTIMAIHKEKEVSGIRYRNVIEVQKQDFYKHDEPDFILLSTAHFFYAKDVGEIYSSEDSHGEYATDTENKLIAYSITK
jgi:hypothetical protein